MENIFSNGSLGRCLFGAEEEAAEHLLGGIGAEHLADDVDGGAAVGNQGFDVGAGLGGLLLAVDFAGGGEEVKVGGGHVADQLRQACVATHLEGAGRQTQGVVPGWLQRLVFQGGVLFLDGHERREVGGRHLRVVELEEDGLAAKDVDAVVGEEWQVYGVGRADDGLHDYQAPEGAHGEVRQAGAARPVIALQAEPHPLAGEGLPRAYIPCCHRAPLGEKVNRFHAAKVRFSFHSAK